MSFQNGSNKIETFICSFNTFLYYKLKRCLYRANVACNGEKFRKVELENKKPVKNSMRKEIDKINGDNYIYHRFTFDAAIQNHTFIGDEFIGMDPVEETRNLNAFERVVAAGPYGFMPNLVEEIKKVLGEGNYIYDGYEIGEEDFGIYFFIKAERYESLLKKVKLWSKAVDVDGFMWWGE